MGRHYSFADVNTAEKPRITARARTFGAHTYSFECKGRSSVGYGYTPEHAYRQWEKNWSRRLKFYGQRHTYAEEAVSQRPVLLVQPKTNKLQAKTVACKRCDTTGLHWAETDAGWRLFGNGQEMHSCRPAKA